MWHVFICRVYNGAKIVEQKIWTRKRRKEMSRYSSPLHSMHYTNSTGRIISGMTPKQYPHSF